MSLLRELAAVALRSLADRVAGTRKPGFPDEPEEDPELRDYAGGVVSPAAREMIADDDDWSHVGRARPEPEVLEGSLEERLRAAKPPL